VLCCVSVKQKCHRTALNNAWSLQVKVSYEKDGGKGSMELTRSISHRFQVWIRVRIEDSSRNREKERKSDLIGETEGKKIVY